MSGSNIGYKIHVYFESLHIRPPTRTQLEAADDGRRRRLTGYVMTNANLGTAVDAWCTDEAAATATYGDIKTWNTEGVTSMVGLMCPHYQNGVGCGSASGYGCRPHMATCNPDIGFWNTGAVTDMRQVAGPPLE